MKLAIIGNGAVGAALARLFRSAGHQVALGSRHPSNELGTTAIADAVIRGDVVVLAVPFSAITGLLPSLAESLAGKIVVDPTNPLNADWSPRLLGQEHSAGEEVGRLLPQSRVVKAFNTVFADVMTKERLTRGDHPVTAFVAGDDKAAVDTVADLAKSAGFAPVKVGALPKARYLEAMAHLNIGIAVGQNGGTNAAFVYHQMA
jgi:8-hydroxy-5-deazaflavin:NADPH oxidoreductase